MSYDNDIPVAQDHGGTWSAMAKSRRPNGAPVGIASIASLENGFAIAT